MEQEIILALVAALKVSGDVLSKVFDGAAEGAGDELRQTVIGKLKRWAGLDGKAERAAFERALASALSQFKAEFGQEPEARVVVALLSGSGQELKAFQQIAVQELVFTPYPNLGRLLDQYQRILKYPALLQALQIIRESLTLASDVAVCAIFAGRSVARRPAQRNCFPSIT